MLGLTMLLRKSCVEAEGEMGEIRAKRTHHQTTALNHTVVHQGRIIGMASQTKSSSFDGLILKAKTTLVVN